MLHFYYTPMNKFLYFIGSSLTFHWHVLIKVIKFIYSHCRYVLTGKLWIVMGAGWISELLSTMFSYPLWLWAVVDLINELQGLFIFLIFVCKPKVYHLLRKRLGKDCLTLFHNFELYLKFYVSKSMTKFRILGIVHYERIVSVPVDYMYIHYG